MTPARTAVPVLALAAHKLRAGWRGWATLAVLVALAGGTVLAAVAGAIRTDTAYSRFLAASSPDATDHPQTEDAQTGMLR